MNVLILGSGGREHVFAWKISQSPLRTKLFVAPGNAGTAQIAENVVLDQMNFEAVCSFCEDQNIQLLIPAAEAPLVAGIVDYFAARQSDIFVWGPAKNAARLEGSKHFAKVFMDNYNIPTASYAQFSKERAIEAHTYIDNQTPPIVLKADGLAAGKGVLICHDGDTAKIEFDTMINGKFGDASNSVVIESFLKGIEFSVFVLTDGKDYKILPTAKDYKRIGEGDSGLNTGGMGSVSPPPFVNDAIMEKVRLKIIEPTMTGIQNEGLSYNGFIFLGLMLVDDEPFVIEYNVRMGDPETQSVFSRLENDLLELALACRNGTLTELNIEESKQVAATVVSVSGGYPEAYTKGYPIQGIDDVGDIQLFHAGTLEKGSDIVTNGGRVIAVTATHSDLHNALEKAYDNLAKINYTDQYYRKDIGFDLELS